MKARYALGIICFILLTLWNRPSVIARPREAASPSAIFATAAMQADAKPAHASGGGGDFQSIAEKTKSFEALADESAAPQVCAFAALKTDQLKSWLTGQWNTTNDDVKAGEIYVCSVPD